MRPVTIIDCGLSNIDSVARALEYCGGDPIVTRDPAVVRDAGRLVLPGVGAFPEAMRRLNESGLSDAVREAALNAERPILGICLGMQLLATAGQENAFTQGLGIIAGDVLPLQRADASERIPHIGWNTVEDVGDCALLKDAPTASDFYFVHSYRFVAKDPAHVAATTPSYGGFASVVAAGVAYGAQFHPEKSQTAGFCLLKAFVGL